MQLDYKFEAGNGEEYEVNGIQDSTVYAKESVGQRPGLYYLVLWKSYPEKENTWEPALAIQHLQSLVTAYHKDNPEKPMAISVPVDTALSMARLTALLMTRPTAALSKKRGRLMKFTTTTKQAKKS